MCRGTAEEIGESSEREKSRYEEESVKASAAAGERKGLRCRICTGCGLCPGVTPRRYTAAAESAGSDVLHVLSRSFLPEETFGGECGENSEERAAKCRGETGGLREAASWGRGNTRLVTADVGTTTVAMLLHGAGGRAVDRYVEVNPQTAYGADVISRIRAAGEARQAGDMSDKIRGTLTRGIDRFRRKLAPGEKMQIVLAANTTMTYLLMGWDTTELGRAPFRASHTEGAETEVAGVPCMVFPGASAFVGGDIVAGMYACGMGEREELTLLIDLGTNGEMVLGNRLRRIACAAAAGPAFEGGANRGVWGADMISRLAALRRAGLLDETGLLAEECFESGVRVGNVHVTREAVRALQLAKGAVAAGVEILLEKYGIDEERVDRVVLAGGFGYYLNPADAAEIGLLPEKLVSKATAGGNTALAGALRAGRRLTALSEEGMRKELQGLSRDTEVLNLAEESDFQERYMAHLSLQRC